jgi:choline dehydrogenase
VAADWLVARGGTVILSETTEMIGPEEVIKNRAATLRTLTNRITPIPSPAPIRFDAQPWLPLLTKRQKHVFSIGVVVLHPESRGHIALKSADAHDLPRVHMNLFSDERDFATMRRGIRAARRIYRTGRQAELTGAETLPGNAAQSDGALDEFIRASAVVCQHPVGTCSMGADTDAVVDPELRVRGLAGLRIADASIMPTVPGGNTNAAAIMVGEVAADLLRGRRLPAEDERWLA